MKWLMLLLAIVLEACGTTSMKLSNGFANFVPSVLMFVLYGASLVVLDVALKQIPVGIAYAIWSGLGIVIISSIDAFYFKESLSLQQILFILLILVGVAGLNLSSLHSRTR
ncbi:DMT family transporter [Alicyclobacillus mengziensis]|uniref:Multidrug efflux SMR transporter n=1 Tax=Alicyclobacillus mengziensis TaxID=2931921 RepID=A0A9X7VWS2_9BACL|nr:multidrug efflux SMR transporter [Alicyclobacillus mengziensis]QSO46506.1 multidrug efflux SMR transporter [Alicyclobacillus mengziensis]